MAPPEWARYTHALPSIASAVGGTPLVRLNRITADVTPALYVKVEWYGATGSLKDRIYLHMFERAEARGNLTPGMSVLECSTGNAGIACAWVSAVKGYACTIVMPEGMSEERKKIMRAHGFEPRNLDVAQLTGIITTTTEESVETARRLARDEGIFCGISSGCNVAAALKLARRHPELPSIVTIINDTGQRYFTTPLCGEAKHVDIPERPHPLDPHTVDQLDRYQKAWEIIE